MEILRDQWLSHYVVGNTSSHYYISFLLLFLCSVYNWSGAQRRQRGASTVWWPTTTTSANTTLLHLLYPPSTPQLAPLLPPPMWSLRPQQGPRAEGDRDCPNTLFFIIFWNYLLLYYMSYPFYTLGGNVFFRLLKGDTYLSERFTPAHSTGTATQLLISRDGYHWIIIIIFNIFVLIFLSLTWFYYYHHLITITALSWSKYYATFLSVFLSWGLYFIINVIVALSSSCIIAYCYCRLHINNE